jgi:hypothetical protein
VPTAEATLRARILAAVRTRWTRRKGVLLFGRPASAATGPGHPDLLGVVRGRYLGLEIKKLRGRVTPLQAQRIRELREAGAYAWVVRSVEQAITCIQWTFEEGRVPMAEEPLDINDWLTSSNGTTAEPEVHDDVPVEAMAEAVQAAQRPTVTEAVTAVTRMEQIERTGFDTDLDRLRMDVRTVGDRVTIVAEDTNKILLLLGVVLGRIDKLMALIDPEDEPLADIAGGTAGIGPGPVTEGVLPDLPPDPPKRRTRRKDA